MIKFYTMPAVNVGMKVQRLRLKLFRCQGRVNFVFINLFKVELIGVFSLRFTGNLIFYNHIRVPPILYHKFIHFYWVNISCSSQLVLQESKFNNDESTCFNLNFDSVSGNTGNEY